MYDWEDLQWAGLYLISRSGHLIGSGIAGAIASAPKPESHPGSAGLMRVKRTEGAIGRGLALQADMQDSIICIGQCHQVSLQVF